jgi:hypothetical protein
MRKDLPLLAQLTVWRGIFVILSAAFPYALYLRVRCGLGGCTNLSDQFPWGPRIGFDGFITHRLNVAVTGRERGPGTHYIPKWTEVRSRDSSVRRDSRFSGRWRSTFECSKHTRRKPMP